MIWVIGVHGSNENCGSRFTLFGVATKQEAALAMFDKMKETIFIDGYEESYEMYEIEENKLLKQWIG